MIFCHLHKISDRLYSISADDLANILQDLAVQTACLGMYSTAQTGVLVSSRYDDPLDWYDPPMMANRFAAMSGDMTRINTFYGICFDYAQFAWDDIKKYKKDYNDAGMKGAQWYIAVANVGDPNTIILYDPVSSRENATIISNGVYLKENSRHKIYAHDGASGHAWLWVQYNNGTWYWIDPTWTDNTGYPWWGIVKDGKEVQYYPNPDYCVATNYPRPGKNNTETRSPNSTYTENTSRGALVYLFGYNYVYGMPYGITFGANLFYGSVNFGVGGTAGVGDTHISLFGMEGQWFVTEWIVGASWPISKGGLSLPPLSKGLLMPIGIGANYTAGENKFVIEIGLQPVLFGIYISATYRLIGFKKSGFSIGAGFIF